MVAAILAMTLNMAAYTTEIVGAGLDAVPKGQKEAALALGCAASWCSSKIAPPQALKVIFPALTSQIVIMMLESAVVSQIAVRELTHEADLLQARTFRAFETYLVVTAVYLGLSIGLRRLLLSGGRSGCCRRVRHDRVHLLGHRAQPALGHALDDPAVDRRLPAAPSSASPSCCSGYPGRKWPKAASAAATSRCSRARRC